MKKTEWLQMLYGFTAQIALILVGLVVLTVIGVVSGALTIGKYAAGGNLLYMILN